MENGNNVRKRKPKKNQKKFKELKHSQRAERKRKLETAFKDVTNTLHPEISEVNVQLRYECGRTVSFTPRKPDPVESDMCLKWENEEIEDKYVAQQFLAIKDKYRISDEAFHELHMIGKAIPSKNKLQEEKKRDLTPLFKYFLTQM